MYLIDGLYQHDMSGIGHLGLPIHPATLRGKQPDIQNICTALSTAILADIAGKVECQGNGNCCGFYTILNGMNLQFGGGHLACVIFSEPTSPLSIDCSTFWLRLTT